MADEIPTAEQALRRPRGRPRKQISEPVRESVRTAVGSVVVQGRDGEILTRSRNQNLDRFDVPVDFIQPGWSYQWNAVSAHGNTEVFQAMNVEFYQNGWRPVPASRHDGYFMPRGHTGPIIVGGQMLVERPLALTLEAKAEQENLAKQQMRDRDAALMGGRSGVREAMRGGFEMGGKYRGTGGDLKISVAPEPDAPSPSYQMPDD